MVAQDNFLFGVKWTASSILVGLTVICHFLSSKAFALEMVPHLNRVATKQSPDTVSELDLPQSHFDLGPILDSFALTLGTGSRLEALGPLYYRQAQEDKRAWGIPPLISYHQDTGVDALEWDILYPLVTYDRFGQEYRFQILQLFSFSGGLNIDSGKRDRFQLFPFYLQQRSQEDPTHNYTSLLPFYGHMRQKFFRDEIRFLAFPAYVETRKRDVVTKNYLLPFYHRRTGLELDGWQIWPFFGTETKSSFSRTNQLEELEISPGHEKRFLLWPFYSEARTGLGTDNPETSLAILPFGAWQRSAKRDSVSYLWPFFNHVTDREKKYEEWAMPWPFIVRSKGAGKNGFRFWPIYGHATNQSLSSETVLWPLWRKTKASTPAYQRERTRGLLMAFSDLKERNLDLAKNRRRIDLWPLWTWKKDWDDEERLQVLAFLEPFLPGNKSIERNWSPIWSIYRLEKEPKTGKQSLSVFWNLYRSEQDDEEGSKKSALFGLFQVNTSKEGQRRIRFFFWPKASGGESRRLKVGASTK